MRIPNRISVIRDEVFREITYCAHFLAVSIKWQYMLEVKEYLSLAVKKQTTLVFAEKPCFGITAYLYSACTFPLVTAAGPPFRLPPLPQISWKNNDFLKGGICIHLNISPHDIARI